MVIGSVVLQMVAGTVYVWGTISIYACSFLQQNGDPDASYESTALVIPFNYLLTAAFVPLVVGPCRCLHPKIIIAFGSLLITLSVFLTQYARSSTAILLLFGVSAGVGEACVFLTPVVCALHYYPQRKGLITGLSYAGLSLGLFFFSELFFAFANPDNLSPDIEHVHGDVVDLYYSAEVANHYPRSISYISIILLIFSIAATVLIRMPGAKWKKRLEDASVIENRKILEDSEVEEPPLSSKDVLSSGAFWKLYAMAVLASFFGSYMYSVAKPFGLMKNGDDHFNTLAITIAGLVGGGLRFLWTWGIDIWGFKKVGAVLFTVIILVSCTLPSVASTKALYFIWIVLSVMCDAAIIALFPAVSAHTFGIEKGTMAFSIIFSGIALILVAGSLISEFLVAKVGYESFFYASGVAAGLALFLHLCIPTKHLENCEKR